MSNYKNVYFAADEAKSTASSLLNRANHWYNQLDNNGYLNKLRDMWAAYHGATFTGLADAHSINFSGEQGELAQIQINHLRNLAQHMLVMTTSTRPSLQARAVNTDHKSLVQARLANGLLDYYLREKKLEDYLKVAVEYAIVLGSGYIKMEWNSTSGELYDFNEETGTEIYEGDVEFSNLSPFDVVFDPNREDQKHDWVMCRSFKNRHDMIAKYPEFKDKIQGLSSKSELESYFIENMAFNQTDLIPIYEFYHKRSESMPDGRYILFLSDDIILLDSPMPYRALPVYRIAPSTILGTPFGYTPLFDILPVQEAINSLYSTILTNQNAFGVQNILVPRGSDVGISELSGGLNVIEANTQFGEIKPLNLTNTPEEIFRFLQMFENVAETLSGVNSVARGNPESSLKSGTALALIQSMALQFMSGLQQSYVQMVEDVGTGLINMLKDFAEVPRVAMISGIRNKSSMKEFIGEDISSVNRVIVDIGNPLARSTAGRVQMAEQLLQMGVITKAEQYIQIINTGNLDSMTEDVSFELELIRDENERLVEGKDVIAIATDEHTKHIQRHKAVLSDSSLRFDPELSARVYEHIQEHIDLLRNTDADLLAIIDQQPLGPAGGSPANQLNQNLPVNSISGIGPDMTGAPTVQQQQGTMLPNAPSPATPPPPFQNLPTNPQDILPS